MGRAGHELGRLEHDRVAVGERRRDLPRRDRDRKIPGRDDPDHPDRLARRLDVDVRAHRSELLAGDSQRLAGEEIEDLAGPGDFADRLGQRLALFAGEEAAEFVAPGEDFQRKPATECRAAPAASCAPMPGRQRARPLSRRPSDRRRACAYSPTMSFVSDGLTFLETPTPSTHSPAMRFLCRALMVHPCIRPRHCPPERHQINPRRAKIAHQRAGPEGPPFAFLARSHPVDEPTELFGSDGDDIAWFMREAHSGFPAIRDRSEHCAEQEDESVRIGMARPEGLRDEIDRVAAYFRHRRAGLRGETRPRPRPSGESSPCGRRRA